MWFLEEEESRRRAEQEKMAERGGDEKNGEVFGSSIQRIQIC